MTHRILSAVLLLGTLTASSQKPAPPKDAAPKADKAAATPAAPAAPAVASAVAPEKVKELKDAMSMFQLDQLEIQTAQQNVAKNDPVAKKAMQILRDETLQDADVQKAQKQADTDRKALQDKINALRKDQNLDDTYDWDFNMNRFVQTKPQPGGKPAGE